MSKSAQIRALGTEGLPVAEIARKVGVSYQHARGVLLQAGLLRSGQTDAASRNKAAAIPPRKPSLNEGTLLKAGFRRVANWELTSSGDLSLSDRLPAEPGVYAFVINGMVLYVGLATMGLARRLYFYSRPGISQRTNERLNGLIKTELGQQRSVDIYAAFPDHMEWNGLPLCPNSALEAGLIRSYVLPWNVRGAS